MWDMVRGGCCERSLFQQHGGGTLYTQSSEQTPTVGPDLRLLVVHTPVPVATAVCERNPVVPTGDPVVPHCYHRRD